MPTILFYPPFTPSGFFGILCLPFFSTLLSPLRGFLKYYAYHPFLPSFHPFGVLWNIMSTIFFYPPFTPSGFFGIFCPPSFSTLLSPLRGSLEYFAHHLFLPSFHPFGVLWNIMPTILSYPPFTPSGFFGILCLPFFSTLLSPLRGSLEYYAHHLFLPSFHPFGVLWNIMPTIFFYPPFTPSGFFGILCLLSFSTLLSPLRGFWEY